MAQIPPLRVFDLNAQEFSECMKIATHLLTGKILIELMKSDRTLEASSEGSK